MNNPGISGLLAMNIFLSGAAFAAMTPYRAIVGVETLGMSNAAFGLVIALNALGGSLIAVLLGWLSDKVADRRVLVLLCAIGGALVFVLVWAVRTPVGFATAFCLLVPFGNVLFSQSISHARAFFDREAPACGCKCSRKHRRGRSADRWRQSGQQSRSAFRTVPVHVCRTGNTIPWVP